MEVLLNRRRGIKGRITRIENVLGFNDPTSPTPGEGKVIQYLQQATQVEDDLLELHHAISEVATEEEYAKHEDEYMLLAERLDSLKIALTDVKIQIDEHRNLVNASLNTSLNSTPTPPPPTAKIQLPKLDLPTFNGNLQDWISYHDLFKAIVHNNKSLSDAQKLQYLKVSLKGEAAQLLQTIQVTDDNYPKALDILQNRYENKKEIIKTVLDRLINQPSLQHDSPVALRKLVDTTTECVNMLEAMKVDKAQWGETIVIHMIVKKLDSESRLQWERASKATATPTYEEFSKFLEEHSRVISAASSAKPKMSYNGKIPMPSDPKGSHDKPKSYSRSFAATENTSKSKCKVCDGDHPLFRCDQFRSSSLQDKWSHARKYKLCFNCLGSHRPGKCLSKNKCFKCKESHHTLLHTDIPTQSPDQGHPQEPSVAPVTLTHVNADNPQIIRSYLTASQGLLSTALVKIRDCTGQLQFVRALVDGGSQKNFITETLVKRLGLKREHACIPIHGLGLQGAGTTKGKLTCHLYSRIDPSLSIEMETFILPTLTGQLPNTTIDISTFDSILSLPLADPNFHQPGRVDLLIGGSMLVPILRDGRQEGKNGNPHALNSMFGWLLSGDVNAAHTTSGQTTTAILSHHSATDVDTQLRKFWELEEVSSTKAMSAEEKKCESLFESTTTREEDGKFVVQFPFKNEPSLGDSRQTALSRFQQVERRIHRNPELLSQYSSFMDEYSKMGHMTLISPRDLNSTASPNYYLPHHAVVKLSSTTTKLRVVFDGSCKSSNGLSLNDNLMVGPRLQEDLADILLRFRTHRIAFTGDIAKMYRQISIHPSQRDFQRILWRKSPQEPISDFRLNTVTYGTASAPYQAVKCLQSLAKFESQNFPEAFEVLLRDFYVDDLMTGGTNIETTLPLLKDVRELTQKGHFPLRKISSNSQELLDSIPAEDRETQVVHVEFDQSVGTLGLRWHPSSDTFSFAVNLPEVTSKLTKRTLLSDVARIFDPLGWLARSVISCKILFQKLWKEKLNWDDPLPEVIANEWLLLRSSLSTIQDVSIPRWLQSIGNSRQYELHGFSDASQLAFSAAVYLRTTDSQGEVQVNLVTAKTKVAPIKTVSLPRLELCGALLVSRLMDNVEKALRLPISQKHGWTDSTIVLSWLDGLPDRWKTFVANRVSEIQDFIPSQCWSHVPSEDNPADCASRGISPSELKTHPLWWHGPHWLSSDSCNWPSSQSLESHFTELEMKPVRVLTTQEDPDPSYLQRYSSLSKTKRITALCLRFSHNCRSKLELRRFDSLSATEINDSFNRLILITQESEFKKELQLIRDHKPLHKKNPLFKLSAFVGDNGLLRVGGRLSASSVPDEQKFPILLPQKHKLTELIIREYHIRNCHAGSRLLLNSLHQKFWIIRATNAVQRIIHRCHQCVRQRATVSQQVMGDLPKSRIEPSRPFLRTGVDYAGPVTLRIAPGRSKQIRKGYIALFVCMATKAIHLELVSDLTTSAFIAALERFVSRRGKCSHIYSDNGTNFVGANREMQEIFKLVSSPSHNDIVAKSLADDGTTWHFNPPSAPHQGGLWEAGVKSVKFHLRRVIGSAIFTIEEYGTLLCKVEACLNSRPICSVPNSPNDPEALTPGHFLIGAPMTAIPEPDLRQLSQNRLDRWQTIQQTLQHFWHRWSTEYLNTLQQRSKWNTKFSNLEIGNVVLMKEDNLPPTKWQLGLITDTHPGKDGVVRVVSVKCKSGTYKRPIVKLCLLPND